MNKAGRILSLSPPYAIPGGEVIIECEGFEVDLEEGFGCFFDGQQARIVAASSKRVITIVPENFDGHDVEVYLESGGYRSDSASIFVGKKLAEDLHIVSNPAVDPKDDSIILTRSGSRGQSLPVTLFRLEKDGYLQEMSTDIMNPTGVAFDRNGQLFVSNRADGEVCRVTRDEEAVTYSTDLGIATSIAFDKNGVMFVGDRRGFIFKVSGFGIPETFATLEPSVSAYHIAFDNDGNLLATAPGLASYDSIYTINKEGIVKEFYRGLGRPQGIAIDDKGNTYVAACFHGRRGVIRISTEKKADILVAGMNVVGICFNRKGEMIIATNEAVYSLPTNIKGNLF